MKHVYHLAGTFLLLVATLFSYSQSPIPQIDSVQGVFSPYENGREVYNNAGFNVFVSDTNGIDSIHIALGNVSGASDIFEDGFAVSQLTRQYNAAMHRFYYYVYTDHFNIVPPFAEAYLVTAQGALSAVRKSQFVY